MVKNWFQNARVKLGFTLAATALVVGCSGGSDLPSYSKMVVIGASLSDTGNVFALTSGKSPGPAPYFNGRWSNGPLWIEMMAADLGLKATNSVAGGTNYAFGGAKTCEIAGVKSDVPDMCKQVATLLGATGGVADAKALYVIDAASVGNNITAVLGSGGALPSSLITTTAPADIIAQMTSLYDAGARQFLVTNSPDVGATPYVKSLGAPASAAATQLAKGYNAVLAASLKNFQSTKSGSVVSLVDLMELGDKIAANPSAYGIANTKDACLTTAGLCASPAGYQYWDPFHPTSTIGRIFANVALGAIVD